MEPIKLVIGIALIVAIGVAVYRGFSWDWLKKRHNNKFDKTMKKPV